MRAIQITQFGRPEDVVRVVDVPEPKLLPKTLLEKTIEFTPSPCATGADELTDTSWAR